MLLDVLLLLGGGALLWGGAEWLVKGSAGLAHSWGVAPVVVGLTVVAYGTSAPELVVTLVATANGHGEIALGNVIGSNIANIGLILGLTALIRPPKVDGRLIKLELPLLLLATAVVPLSIWDGVVSRLEAALLLAGTVVFTLLAMRARRGPALEQAAVAETLGVTVEPAAPAATGAPVPPRRAKLLFLTVLGLGAVVLGGKLLVQGATGLAIDLGVSERLVGLTVVAIGTSLPELAASVVAALRGHSELAVGNVIGSNIFNVSLVLGSSAMVRPIEQSFAGNRLGLAVLGGTALMGTLMMCRERRISRLEGAALLAVYLGFLTIAAVTRV